MTEIFKGVSVGLTGVVGMEHQYPAATGWNITNDMLKIVMSGEDGTDYFLAVYPSGQWSYVRYESGGHAPA